MRFVLIVLIMAMMTPKVAAGYQPTSSQGADYGPAAPGLEESNHRSFIAASDASTSWVALEVRVARFSNETSARNAISLWFEQLREVHYYAYDLAPLRPVAVDTVGDETRAMVGTATHFEEEEWSLEVAALVVRDGDTLFTFLSWHEYSSPLAESVEIARRTLGLEPLEFEPVPDVPYMEGGLWDLTPRIEHLPEGLTWRGDVYPCMGVFQTVECPSDATPVGSPVATPDR